MAFLLLQIKDYNEVVSRGVSSKPDPKKLHFFWKLKTMKLLQKKVFTTISFFFISNKNHV